MPVEEGLKNPNGIEKGNVSPVKLAKAKEEAISPTLHLSEKGDGEKEDTSDEGKNETVKESIWEKIASFIERARGKKYKGGISIETIEKNKDTGKTRVRHQIFDKNGKILHDHYRY